MISTIIFDFDGTLADTLEAGIATVNLFADKYGFKKIMPGDYERLRNLPSLAILKDVGVSLWKVPFIAREVRKKFREQIPLQKVYAGIPQALLQIKQSGCKLGVLTNNSKENVELFLKYNNLENVFEFIHSESNLFGKGRVLKKLLSKYRLDRQKTIYVGDETKDTEAARQAGIKIASVTWGVNSKKILQAQNPDYLIENPEELIKIF